MPKYILILCSPTPIPIHTSFFGPGHLAFVVSSIRPRGAAFKNRKTQVAPNKELMRLAIVKGQHSFWGFFTFPFSFFPLLFGPQRDIEIRKTRIQGEVWKWDPSMGLGVRVQWGKQQISLTDCCWELIEAAWQLLWTFQLPPTNRPTFQPELNPSKSSDLKPELKPAGGALEQSCQLAMLPAVNEHSTG